MSNILILGCGPAGLLAAHAALLADSENDVRILSKKRKSHLFGCQYLHAPIPVVQEDDPVEVEYILQGTPSEYARKVYGATPPRATSVDEYGPSGHHAGWDLRSAYDRLWGLYGDFVIDRPLASPQELQDLLEDWRPDLTVSTIPAPLLCADDSHFFESEMVWARGDTPENRVPLPIPIPENTVVCNGEPDVSWYRIAKVFGFSTIEYPGDRQPPFSGMARVQKPLKTNCNCSTKYAAPILQVGRYGKWRKGFLAHEAFSVTLEALQNQQGRLW